MCQSLFEDDEEMKQATRFLHQRGVSFIFNPKLHLETVNDNGIRVTPLVKQITSY